MTIQALGGLGFLALLVGAPWWAAAAIPESDPALLQRFQSEYPAAVSRLEAAYANCNGTAQCVVTIPQGPKAERTIRSEIQFAFSDGNERTSRRFVDASPARTGARDQVSCLNAKYLFSLEKTPEDRNYALKGVADVAEEEPDALGTFTMPIKMDVRAAVQLDRDPMSGLMAEPGFRFTSAAHETVAGRPVVKVDFERNAPDADYVRGSIFVDPEHAWAIVRHEVYFAKEDRHPALVGVVEYGDDVDGVPVPRRVLNQGPSREFLIKSFATGRTPEREFLLSAFGLPEIDQVVKPPGMGPSAWLWGAAAVFLGAAGLLTWYSRRRFP